MAFNNINQVNYSDGSYSYSGKTFDENHRNDENIREIRESRTNHKSSTIANLNNKIRQIDEFIKNNHDVTSFIKFKVNGFELDTSDPDSFKHYAISMENQKTGVGQGNQFKIKIAYHKHFSNYNNVNQLEFALTQMRNGSLFNYKTNAAENARRDLNTKNKCTLQYGYIYGGKVYISPEYVGLLLKYSVTANKQIIEYTLEGFTGEQVAINTVNWYPLIEGADEDKLNNIKIYVGQITSENDLSETKKNELLAKINSYYNTLAYQPFIALDHFLKDYNTSVKDSDGATKYYLLDCTDETNDRLWKPETLEPVYMSICRGQTPIQYIEYCIGLFKYRKTQYYAIEGLNKLKETTPRFVYNIVTDKDDSTKKYICVDVIDDNNSDNKVAYTFTGYATDNSLMIDYNLNYDGTVALAVANMYDKSQETDSNSNANAIYIDKDGSLRAQTSMTRDMFVSGAISEVLITKQNTWLDKISCANNCTMTTFGLPFEISVGTIFKCGIYITDILHHTSGNCFVTGVTDRINNSMFTTEFRMIRLPGKNSAIDDNPEDYIQPVEEDNKNNNVIKGSSYNKDRVNLEK